MITEEALPTYMNMLNTLACAPRLPSVSSSWPRAGESLPPIRHELSVLARAAVVETVRCKGFDRFLEAMEYRVLDLHTPAAYVGVRRRGG